MRHTIPKSTLFRFGEHLQYPTIFLLLGLLSLPVAGADTDRPIDLPAAHRENNNGLTTVQKAQIGEIAANWLDENPAFLNATPERLRQQQEAQRQVQQALILQNRAALLDGGAPSVGPKDATVAVIMFFDYQCIYCSKMNPILTKLHEDNPDVRFIFREYPIFAARWPVSSYAARVGEAVWAHKGGNAYLHYHNNIFGSQKTGGKLAEEDVNNAAHPYLDTQQLALAEAISSQNDLQERIDINMELGGDLLLSRTPTIIVLPVNGTSDSSTSVMSYNSNEVALQQALLKAKLDARSQ